ncbi:MAG TPA: proton-conducting membrane transporter, partial [Firmicutes bacterium]|nr:proton-conducting membrane transporter [Bacillota bacterium]
GQLVDWGQTALVPWVGTLLVIIGVLTMLVGVCLALLQGNAKRLLAYHSISQMGYIILGIGSALVLKQNGALGITGAIFHSLNHALFKSALFFGVGIVILGTGEADLYKLGGLWRKFPFTGLMMFIAALGITGMPGLNGYISKTLLHHGILEAAALGSPIMIWGERLFIVVGVGTTASFVKLIGLTFFGRQKTEVREGRGEGLPLAIAMLLLSVVMLVIGLKPEWALTLLIYPAAQSGG